MKDINWQKHMLLMSYDVISHDLLSKPIYGPMTIEHQPCQGFLLHKQLKQDRPIIEFKLLHIFKRQ